jgi:hypothetical protein
MVHGGFTPPRSPTKHYPSYMKRHLNPLYSLLLLLGLTFGVASCTDDSPTDPGNGGDKPVINSFTATPATIDIGSSTTLAWSVDDAESISIDNGVGVQTGTSVEIFPGSNTTYTLTATNADGSTTKTVTVTVNNPSDPGAPPNPTTLTATPGNPGIITLNWQASAGASSYLVERRGPLGAFSLVTTANINSYADAGLFPGTVYTYRVRAVNSSGARSGWSNFATATAPGTAPVIDRVELTPTNAPALQPGGTLQMTAKAFDANGNNLNLAAGIFTWNSTNPGVAAVSQLGLVTVPLTATQGTVQVTAAVGGVTSNAVTVNVSAQKNTTLVIFHGRYSDDDDWSLYSSAFGTTSYDQLIDAPGEVASTISLDVLEGYDRVFYFDRNDGMHASTQSLLRLYAMMPNKRLIVMGDSYLFSGNASFLSTVGLQADNYHGSTAVNSTFVGGAGTVMEGFNFDFTPDFSYVSDLTLSATNPATPAFTTTLISNGEPVITAIQANVGASSKFFYGGFVLENVQSNLRDEFIAKLMAM